MAPALIETPQPTSADKVAQVAQKSKDVVHDGFKEAFAQSAKNTNYEGELNGTGKFAPAKYPNYLPYWDDTKHPPYELFEEYEHGKDADASFSNLLAGAQVEDLTANIGAEVKGVQLSKLNKAGKDELALFVAQKKVVGMSVDYIDCLCVVANMVGSFPGPRLCRPANSGGSRFR